MPTTEKQITELVEFFKSKQLPVSFQLGLGNKIGNVTNFVNSHLRVVQHNGDKGIADVFYLRLVKLKDMPGKE